jgi:hypothetical protein
MLVMMEIHAPSILVMQRPTNVSTLELNVLTTISAQSTSVSTESATTLKRRTVMTTILAQLMLVMQNLDANTPQRTATTITFALLTLAILNKDVFMQ